MSELAAASGTYFPGRLGFATTADIEEFVSTLERYEKGELSAEEWRAFRLLRGVYHQRQSDVQMLRVKVPQGILSATQLRALALVAARDGDGQCDVTTRQNFQFHNIRLAHIERAMYTLADVGMTTREACGNSIRTVTACPLAGVDPEEVFDVTPYADAFTRYLLRGPLSSSLPRKFKVAFEGCHRGCVRAPINDLAFVARTSPSGQPGFVVLCGGGTSTLPRSGGVLVDFLPGEELLSLSEAVVRVFHREGNRKNRHRARIKWVIEKLGFPSFKELILVEWQKVKAEAIAALPFDPQQPPVEPAPAQPVVPERASSALALHDPSFVRWQTSNVRSQKQPGFSAVTVTLPMGALTATQLQLLADLTERFGDGFARTTVEQNITLRYVPTEAVPALYEALAANHLATTGAGHFSDVVSCPGAQTCAIAVTTSRQMGRVLRQHLSGLGDAPGLRGASIHLSGCPNGCGQHHVATIGLQGGLRKLGGKALPVYHLGVGGGIDNDRAHFTRLVGKLPAQRGPQAIDRLLSLWKSERQHDAETLSAFYRSVPIEKVKAAVEDLLDIDEQTATPADFIDHGQSAPYTSESSDAEAAG
ncbi:MAG: nitrite/sulfite reductase [Myxococcales bacterium]|nr:nitrite/sulfite reductase [Myxococcales bacterium]